MRSTSQHARATAAGRVVRLVFDFGASTIAMEETPDRHTIKKGSLSGDAADTAEDLARDAADAHSSENERRAAARYGLLDTEERIWIFRRVEYDLRDTSRRMRRSGLW